VKLDIPSGLIVSCYASRGDINHELADPYVMAHIAHAVELGGARGVRTNLENVKEIKNKVKVPVVGIKKIARDTDGFETGDFRITPTLKEVEALKEAGADMVAVDGTRRPRYDELSLEEFIRAVREDYGLPLIADVSTFEEGIKAWEYGADAVGTTLSGYTPYSKNPIKFGTIPAPGPDFEIIEELAREGVKVVAEGRIKTPQEARQALNSGAHSVVVGTAITIPRKITESFVYALEKEA